METKTLVVIVAGLVILALLFVLVIYNYYGKGIPVIDLVIEYLKKAIEGSSWLTGNMTEWPEWAK